MTVAEQIKELQKRDPNEVIACSVWSVEDVIDYAEQLDREITEEQAKEVLNAVDYNTEITWDAIETELDDIEE